MKRLCILSFCCFFMMLAGVQLASAVPAVEISHDSWIDSPQLNLYEEGNDYARLGFSSIYSPYYWHIAGYPGMYSYTSEMNFYWSQAGDIFKLRGDGRAEISNPEGGPAKIFFSSGPIPYRWELSGDLTATPSSNQFSILHDSTAILRLSASGMTEVFGTLRISDLPAGGATAVCANASNLLSQCTSSREYKKNIQEMSSGLGIVEKLRPVFFDWKETGRTDLGLIAEEVADVEPRLAIANKKGQIDGVKYMNLTAVLVKAVQEQQALIKEKDNRISKLEKALETIEGRLASLEIPARTIASK